MWTFRLKRGLVFLVLILSLSVGTFVTTLPQLPQPGGDLVIKEITIAPESPKPGDIVTITATVLNQDKRDIKQDFNVRFDVVFPVVGRAQVAVMKVSRGLKAREEKQVQLQWEVLELPIIRIRFTVDAPLDQVQEIRENNNWLEKMIQIPEEYIGQWGLDRIGVREAWKVTKGSEDVVVAVIDTGVDYTHPELDANIWVNLDEIPDNDVDDDGNGYVDDIHGWDFEDNDNDSLAGSKIHWHGTAMAGVIAAEEDGFGVTGAAPHVRIMDLRVCDEEGACGFAAINTAIRYAADNGADVINISLGLPYEVVEKAPAYLKGKYEAAIEAQEEALNYAAAKGAIIAASAGNEAAAVGYPARFDAVIAVAATNVADGLAPYSNFGPEVDLAAPGGDISEEELYAKLAESFADIVPVLKTLIIVPFPAQDGRPGYAWSSGTSPAAAFVSGVVALLLSINPDLTLAEVKSVLAETSEDLGQPGKDEKFGYGLVNAARAVEHLVKELEG